MVTMSSVWDRTTDVLSGRAGMLTRIALVALFLPAVVRDGWAAYAGATSTATTLIGGILALLVLLATIWGQLAITAVASDPATTQGDATRQATRRFGPALAIYAAAVLVAALLFAPMIVALAGSNIDWTAMSRGQAPQISAGVVGFVGIYAIILFIAFVVLTARLFLLNPVILNERAGLHSYARSWSLTRGLAWRIIGVVLLFAIVLGIASSAVALVAGIVLRLLLGAEALATVQFLTALVSAAVTTVYVVVVAVFAAQLYAAISGRRAADILS